MFCWSIFFVSDWCFCLHFLRDYYHMRYNDPASDLRFSSAVQVKTYIQTQVSNFPRAAEPRQWDGLAINVVVERAALASMSRYQPDLAPPLHKHLWDLDLDDKQTTPAQVYSSIQIMTSWCLRACHTKKKLKCVATSRKCTPCTSSTICTSSTTPFCATTRLISTPLLTHSLLSPPLPTHCVLSSTLPAHSDLSPPLPAHSDLSSPGAFWLVVFGLYFWYDESGIFKSCLLLVLWFLLVFGVGVHDFLVLSPLMYVCRYFSHVWMLNWWCWHFATFVVVWMVARNQSVVFCGRCLRVCLVVCACRVP